MSFGPDAVPTAFRAWVGRLSLARKLTAIGILATAASLVMAAVVLVAYDGAAPATVFCVTRCRWPTWSVTTAPRR